MRALYLRALDKRKEERELPDSSIERTSVNTYRR